MAARTRIDELNAHAHTLNKGSLFLLPSYVITLYFHFSTKPQILLQQETENLNWFSHQRAVRNKELKSSTLKMAEDLLWACTIQTRYNLSYCIFSSINYQPYLWCNGYRARLECIKSWIQDPIGSNQRLFNLYLFLLC